MAKDPKMTKKPRPKKLTRGEVIALSKQVIRQYGDTKLTVRQIYYRLVSAHAIPNSDSSYRLVKESLVDARRAGTISYRHIEDRTRSIHQYHTAYKISETTYAVRNEASEESAESFMNGYLDTIEDIANKYTIPRWWMQPTKVMVFVEKQALSSLFQSVTDELAVDLVVCRGYASLSLLYEIAKSLDNPPDYVERIKLLYFGDFDPSGADIERAITDSLRNDFGVGFDIEHVAITMDQIAEYQIPPAPAKTTDSRYDGFLADTGVAWQVELDAIEPKQLQVIIRDSIEQYFDDDIYKVVRCPELERRKKKLEGWSERCLNEDFDIEEDDK